MYDTIVVGTDGSPTAQEAVARAGELARQCGGVLHIVHGCGAPIPIPEGIMAAPIVMTAEDLGEIEAQIDASAEAIRAAGVDVTVHVETKSGTEAILEAAESLGADLVVVGNQGMTGKRRFILGSVPNAVSHHSPCSVLIVHTR